MAVPQTVTPWRRAASMSMAKLRIPVVTRSLRSGSLRSCDAGNRVRSRMATTTSKPARAAATSASSPSGPWKTSTSAGSVPQSAHSSATFW